MRFVPREDYQGVRSYDVDSARLDVELADNTPVFGTPPGARTLLAGAASMDLTRYPTTYSRQLREVIGRYVGVSPDEVMVGVGSDELLSCTFRALAKPGSRVAHMAPTFVMTPIFARTNSVTPVPVPLTAEFDADANGLLGAQAELTYLCTPNNPTGTPVRRATLERVVREAPGVVMIDEAYAEFAGTNIAGEAPAFGDVVVYRTFSKALGLAGARVGFVVAEQRLIAELEKARGPYTVSALSEQLATAVLTNDQSWIRARVAEVLETRDWFTGAVRDAGFDALSSAANFVLIRVGDAPTAVAKMRAMGIGVRGFQQVPRIGDALRITIGTQPTMQRVKEALMQCAQPA